MAETLTPIRLQLLGHPCVALGDTTLPLGAGRPGQLLAYLAVRGLWQSRDDVAKLFWPESPKKTARSNLRNLLCKAAAALPFAPVESTEYALRLNVSSDMGDFEAAVQRGSWEMAVRLGAAELLKGLEAHASEPYLLWLRSARQMQLAQWTKSVQALLAQPSRPIEERQTLAEAWAAQCPYDEDAVQARLKIAFERQQHSAAASIYNAFGTRLQEEFGVKPSRSLERFALEPDPTSPAESAAISAPPMPRDAARALGRARSRLFGRRLEMGQVESMLTAGEVRLLTLSGPGGVGKSTLLAALFEQCVTDGEAGVCWIDASAAPNAQAVVAAIATALGIEGLQGADNAAALAATLRDRACLLMIDGAEQPGLAAPLALILDRCPRTRLLVASRTRLQLDQERLLVLDGFPLPDHDETDAAMLGRNDAVRFFVDVMVQAGQPVDMARDASTLAALVHAAVGLPLALKLLGKLTRMFSLKQLLDHLRAHMAGAQAAGSPELAELMPALVASFDRSWAALTPPEQAVLARLAVFPAPFDVSAARAVADTRLPLITSLIDRSLVRADGAGRLSLHAGIRACVMAVQPPADDAVAAYIEFYVQQLVTLAGLARVKTVRPFQQFLRDEAAHVEAVWRVALQRRAYPALLSLAQWLFAEASNLGCAADYLNWFTDADHALRDDPNVPNALRAYLLVGSANWVKHHGKVDLALRQSVAALRAAHQARHRDAICEALTMLAMTCMFGGKLNRAEKAIARLVALSNADCPGNLLDLQSMFALFKADYQAALQLLDRHIAINRQLGNTSAVISSLLNRWIVCVACDDTAQASRTLEDRISACDDPDVRRLVRTTVLVDAAQWYVDIGDVARSRLNIQRANAIDVESLMTQALRMKLALVAAAIAVVEQDLATAAQPLSEVLAAIGRGELLSMANAALLYAAKWFRLAGDRDACLVCLRAIRGGLLFKRGGDSARAMMQELGAHLEPGADAGSGPARGDPAEVARNARAQMLALLEETERMALR